MAWFAPDNLSPREPPRWKETQRTLLSREESARKWLLNGLILVVGAFLGFIVSSGSPLTLFRNSETLPAIQLSDVDSVFTLDKSYGEAPSEYTAKLWNDLFPERTGFFGHPTLAPERSTFSVYHQLHCLNGLRHGYWTLYNAASNHQLLSVDDLPMKIQPMHIRHCIDLLRQSLMCQPDLTVEVKNPKVGGVTGFGTEHHCKNWDELIAWTSKWQDYNLQSSEGDGGAIAV